MFKARDIEVGQDVIAFEHEGAALDALRERGRADRLVCPECRHPVRVRSGEFRTTHFAHKHLDNCPSSRVPPEVLEARAALYRWLETKFRGRVTIEKAVDVPDIPRPVDCWVEHDGRTFAYWISEGGIRSVEARAAIAALASEEQARSLNVVVLAKALRWHGSQPGHVLLSPTEREFMRASKYDRAWYDLHARGSLHYIRPASLRFARCGASTSRRSSSATRSRTRWPRCWSRPRRASSCTPARSSASRRGRSNSPERRRLPLRDVRPRRAGRPPYRRGSSPLCRALRSHSSGLPAHQRSALPAVLRRHAAARAVSMRRPVPRRHPSQAAAQEAVCEFCGERTRAWWYFDGKGACRCNACRDRGRTS
jgi:hypothetical protein